jgi:hypothetical protein
LGLLHLALLFAMLCLDFFKESFSLVEPEMGFLSSLIRFILFPLSIFQLPIDA